MYLRWYCSGYPKIDHVNNIDRIFIVLKNSVRKISTVTQRLWAYNISTTRQPRNPKSVVGNTDFFYWNSRLSFRFRTIWIIIMYYSRRKNDFLQKILVVCVWQHVVNLKCQFRDHTIIIQIIIIRHGAWMSGVQYYWRMIDFIP